MNKMPKKNKRSIRKIIIKNFNNNYTSKEPYVNKYFPKIKFSNNLLTQTSINTKTIKSRSQTEPNIIINDFKNNIKNNIVKDSISSTSYLNKTPIKARNDNKYTLKKESITTDQKSLYKTPEINSNNISLSDIYKLPTLIKNDYNTLKFHLQRKQSKKNQLDTRIYSSIEKTLNPIIKSSSNVKSNEIKDMKERMSQGLKGINNNIDINIIDYNKICVKKSLKPINLFKRITSSYEPKKSDEFNKEKVEQYMKDRFYCDTESKMVKKLKYTVFNHDNSLKEKIIEMKKVSGFWGGLADYCIPIFSIRKFEYIKERIKRSKTEGKKQEINTEENKQRMKYDIKPSRLFTINSFLDYKHQKNLEMKKEFIEKYNDSLEYYLI